MALPHKYSAKIANVKCFGLEPQGFDVIRPMNVIIGRNNSGKSALIDLVRTLCAHSLKDIDQIAWRKEGAPFVHFCHEVNDFMADHILSYGRSLGEFPYVRDGKQLRELYIGETVQCVMDVNGIRFQSISPPDPKYPFGDCSNARKREFGEQLCNAFSHPLSGKKLFWLAAERDIIPEMENHGVDIGPNGHGATNAIRAILSVVGNDASLIEEKLLHAANSVLAPDMKFTRILTRQLRPGGPWEIFLEEQRKGQIPLSSSGSGIKTVVLTLLMIEILPTLKQTKLKDVVFAFEELENNLHPALLRRLLMHVRSVVRDCGCVTFVTTHSSSVIDLFAKDVDAQLVHVVHDGAQSVCSTVDNYGGGCRVLDDLDVRPSDLLQANGVVWVEGPSDRTYINRWISLWSGGRFKEGVHYMCAFYGGALNSHLDGGDPDRVEERVALLRMARNMCFVVDSDRRSVDSPLKPHVERIRGEVAKMRGDMWITGGREIENYIPRSAFDEVYGWHSPPASSPYESVFDYMDSMEAERGRKNAAAKPALATKVIPFVSKENSASILDLNERLVTLCNTIAKWNGES